MVRIPDTWARAGFAGLSGGNWIAPPQVRRIPITPWSAYRTVVSVDIGSDGVAPLVTFTAGGAAYALCGPAGLGESWSLDQCYVSTSTGPLDTSQAIVYVGPYMGFAGAVQQYAVTGSLSGGSSQFGLGGLGLSYGWYVQAYWSGGTSGALAQLRVTGAKTVQAAWPQV